LELRLRNAILPGDFFSYKNIEVTKSNAGDIKACIQKLKTLINWDEGIRIDLGGNKIRAKGMACLWKMPNSPTDASFRRNYHI
jgi:xanthine dehydrogenase molybdenum-binding subunit